MHRRHLLADLALIAALALLAGVLAATEDPMRDPDPAVAMAHIRALQYADRADEVIAFRAPAAPDFVDRKSDAATRENTRRIHQGVYGFELVETATEGDAACALLLVAATDGDEPTVELHRFYLWRHGGAWAYLPNPLEHETWYQSVPDELEPGYERLAAWVEAAKRRHADRLDRDAATLIADWRAAAGVEDAVTPR